MEWKEWKIVFLPTTFLSTSPNVVSVLLSFSRCSVEKVFKLRPYSWAACRLYLELVCPDVHLRPPNHSRVCFSGPASPPRHCCPPGYESHSAVAIAAVYMQRQMIQRERERERKRKRERRMRGMWHCLYNGSGRLKK